VKQNKDSSHLKEKKQGKARIKKRGKPPHVPTNQEGKPSIKYSADPFFYFAD